MNMQSEYEYSKDNHAYYDF